jgi:hypothetical protein
MIISLETGTKKAAIGVMAALRSGVVERENAPWQDQRAQKIIFPFKAARFPHV